MQLRLKQFASLALIGSLIAAGTPALAKHGSDDRQPDDRGGSTNPGNGSGSSNSGSGKSVRGMQNGEFRLRGKVGNRPNIEASADYRERIRRGSIVERRFTAEVHNATPGATFDVVIGGRSFGTITANALGIAKLELRPRANTPGDTQIPADFPALRIGNTVQIGTFSVTLRRK
jgi:hypothetical protein